MLWEVDIHSSDADPERARVAEEFDLLTGGSEGKSLVRGCSRGFLVEGDINQTQATRLVRELFLNPLVEDAQLTELSQGGRSREAAVTVLLKPGVMDPVAQSVIEAAGDLGIRLVGVRTYRRYQISTMPLPHDHPLRRVLLNDAIEQLIEGPLAVEHLSPGTPYQYHLVTVAVLDLDDGGLEQLSRDGQLSLTLAEMRTIQEHFRSVRRDPTHIELESIAQTWSEHCSHKTLKGKIEFEGRVIDNLLKETIFGATQEIRRRLGADDWCISVFEDNAGVVQFNENFHACFKVETHNHPSAIEPYGGANTGLGGVIRDPLGTGLGAKPICNTDVFCFAPPDTAPHELPNGVLHPRKVMRGVVAGVRDYGNRMGIPTVNGAICFDSRYLANPLVYCGTVGLIPINRSRKQLTAGDLIVAVGGRTGRDGIHGATFSSIELSAESESISGGAVQIGNPITQKKMLDVLLRARDRGLYNAITDCGAGGFSSAVGEMAAELGAHVDLDKSPLKYEGLSYTEIWISEAQERMVLSVSPENWAALRELCASEGVEATAIGHFEASQRLQLFYQGNQVADLDLHFLHDGRPPVIRKACRPQPSEAPSIGCADASNLTDVLAAILRSWSVCSKEWVIRQYDHEVQGGSVIKPLVGSHDDGPSDAAVVMPVLGDWRGLAVGCGLNPRYGDLDPYSMAAAVIDEAVRNVVAVGADPSRIALLDNFCWGNTDRPDILGSLVLAAQACRDVALAYGMPFISGKDSLKNEYHSQGRHLVIPPTLLISALGYVPDARRCVTMDLKAAGNILYLVGRTCDELGGSHYHLVTGHTGGTVPSPILESAPSLFRALHQSIQRGLVRSCHDLSEGGMAVALAEMAFAGDIGADVTDPGSSGNTLSDAALLFSESTTRFVVEVTPDRAAEFENVFHNQAPLSRIGKTIKEQRLRIAGRAGEWLIWAQLADLKRAWQQPLRW